MKYNHYFISGFSGCKLVAEGHDPYRKRHVRMFMIPGEDQIVGVHDGVDGWVAPLSSPFLEHVRSAIRRFVSGESVPFPLALAHKDPGPSEGSNRSRRVRIAAPVEEPEPAPSRRRVIVEETPARRPGRVRITI